jgi:type 1 glutamine amidotransferase
MVYDEQHMSRYYLGHQNLLLRNISKGNQSAAAGWWREVGEGRFVYLSPGHTPEALAHPMMQRLVRNAMRWILAKRD